MGEFHYHGSAAVTAERLQTASNPATMWLRSGVLLDSQVLQILQVYKSMCANQAPNCGRVCTRKLSWAYARGQASAEEFFRTFLNIFLNRLWAGAHFGSHYVGV